MTSAAYFAWRRNQKIIICKIILWNKAEKPRSGEQISHRDEQKSRRSLINDDNFIFNEEKIWGTENVASELEIMIHAKTYLDKLANGINPLTNEILPETDVVNQVRISRCLFFVSDILRQVIEKGGIKKTPKAAQLPFALSEEQVSRFQLFEQPIFISAITERLNSLAENENMKRLSYRSITAFLEKEGFLIQYSDSQGKLKRVPSDQGMALGITTERRTGSQGDYTVVLYDKNAQQYILDHLNQIAAINQMAKKSQQYTNPDHSERIDEETGEIIRT